AQPGDVSLGLPICEQQIEKELSIIGLLASKWSDALLYSFEAQSRHNDVLFSSALLGGNSKPLRTFASAVRLALRREHPIGGDRHGLGQPPPGRRSTSRLPQGLERIHHALDAVLRANEGDLDPVFAGAQRRVGLAVAVTRRARPAAVVRGQKH